VEMVEGFRKPLSLDSNSELYTGTYGLLIGTEYPSRYGDNYWRTFRYSPEAYDFFKDVVDKRDLARYEAIVGKRERLTAAQQSQRAVVDATLAALGEMLHVRDFL